MILELGHFALALALAIALIQFIVPLAGAIRGERALAALGPPAATLQGLLVIIAFGSLMHAYATSDFSVANVFENSHSLQPFIYKLTSVWGNHEGSMMLWLLVLSVFGAALALGSRDMPLPLRAATLAFQGLLAFAFILFILFTSNPFTRLASAPFEGRDLNPILQDPGLAIHPPMLYFGYVGFSIVFSFAAAALVLGRVDAAWARYVRPWILGAWIFLTLGIAMGSYWAYYILGWGGFWFWDPVENASLMPWLAGTALLHSAIVLEKRGALKVWTILLAILTFSLSLMGTFIVRSGILTSVHTFASDPTRGLFILLILVFFVGGSLMLFAWRAPMLSGGGLFAPVSREGALVFNNLFLSACCLTVFVGTLYPLALEALTGDKISVGPPFFIATMLPLTIPLALAIPFGQNLAWKRGELLGIAQRLVFAAGAGLIVMVVMLAGMKGGPVMAPIGLAIGIYLGFGSLLDLISRAVRHGGGALAILNRLLRQPLLVWGSSLAHFGVGLFVIGIAMTAYEQERIVTVFQGTPLTLNGYTIRLVDSVERNGPNYRENAAQFDILAGGNVIARLEPAKRFYPARQVPTTETARLTLGFSQLYLALGEQTVAGGVALRAYWKPFVLLIWLGPVAMALGGLLSLIDRRLRIGAPARARRMSPVAGAATT